MDRRSFLATGATARAAAARRSSRRLPPLHGAPAAGDARLNALFEEIFQERVRTRPTLASSLGLDKGPNAALKSKFDTGPAPVARAKSLARNRARHRRGSTRSARPRLSDAAKLNREVVLYSLETSTVAPARWNIDSAQRPYPITQQGGAYFSTPDFLNTAHTIDNARRRRSLSVAARPVRDACSTMTPPSSARRPPAASSRPAGRSTWRSARCASCAAPRPSRARWSIRSSSAPAAKGIAGDWQRARRGDRRQERLSRARPADRGDGAAEADQPARRRRLAPAQRRRDLCRSAARRRRRPTSRPPRSTSWACSRSRRSAPNSTRSSGARAIRQGSVGERLAALQRTPAQLYPDSDAGRAELLASLNAGVKDMYGAPAAGLRDPAQPAARNPPRVRRNPGRRVERLLRPRRARWLAAGDLLHQSEGPRRLAEIYAADAHAITRAFRAITCRSASAQESKDIPTLRKLGFFSAYSEGWALYAEQLADELGVYANDPLGRAGFLQSFLFRAARLVVDTGLHSKRWSREQATDYMVTTTGYRAAARRSARSSAIARMIGQACSYKVGHTAWMRARDEAQEDAGRQVRHQAVPRGAARRRDAAVDPRTAHRERSGAAGRTRAERGQLPPPSPRLRASAAPRPRFRRGCGRCAR